MNAHISVTTLGVRDLNRAKQFYSEGLGWPIRQDYGEWVSFSLGDGSSALSTTTGTFRWTAQPSTRRSSSWSKSCYSRTARDMSDTS